MLARLSAAAAATAFGLSLLVGAWLFRETAFPATTDDCKVDDEVEEGLPSVERYS